jgi:PD-(D/E)XK nuclease superfamily
MPQVRREPEPNSPRVALHIGASPEAAWLNVVQPWFEKMVKSPLERNLAPVVVTASRSQAYFFRSQLLAQGKSLLDVKFLSTAQLRELLLRGRDLRVPLREHLRFLLAITADEFAAESEKRGDEQALLVAKSIARDPDHFLRAIDRLGAAGWNFEQLETGALREIAARFAKKVRDCRFTFVYDADRAALEHAQKSLPVFSDLLLFGFDAAHWPLWPLLRAATLSSVNATVVLNDPRDEARELDEAWAGTWEETFDEAKVIPAAEEGSTSIANTHFVIGRDTTQQARAIVGLAAKFLSDPKCDRLGILFPRPGALSRLVATFLQSAGIAHNDGIAHLAPSAFDDDPWRAWLELQQTPRLKSLIRFLRVTDADIFESISILQVEETLRRAYDDLLIDDLELLRDQCAGNPDLRHADEVVHALDKIELLSPSASLTDFLSETRRIFAQFGWKERWNELERLSRDWSARIPGPFSKNFYLRWLRELLGAPSLQRDDLGSHSYARVNLLAYLDAQTQPWSHLIFAGLNDEAWPALDDELAFVHDEQIDELNRQNKILNRRASKRGRQGEGHWSVHEGKTLLLGLNEQRQIRRRQLLNLVESVSGGIGASANLYSEATPSRIANPNDFFSWLYFKKHGCGVSQQTLQTLEAQTRGWLKDWSPVDAQKIDSISVGRTRYAFDQRRQLRAANEYEFALRTELPREISLRVTQWEQALRWPAIIWMEIFLGVTPGDDNGDAWAVATGQWVHRWLAASVRNGDGASFVSVSRADEIRERIRKEARQFRDRVAALCAGRRKNLPDWWRSGWGNALYVADCLAAKVSDLRDWSEMAVEWPLGQPTLISLGEDRTLRIRGRIDLILARTKSEESQIGYNDLWVVDYKTGRQRGFKLKELRRRETPERKFRKQLVDGRGVQLALYALAANSLGAEDVQLTLLSPAEDLEKQFALADVLAQNDFWLELHRMQQSGVFGMLGPVHADFGFVRKYPLATLPIDTDLLENKWKLTHPAFAVDDEEESK